MTLDAVDIHDLAHFAVPYVELQTQLHDILNQEIFR